MIKKIAISQSNYLPWKGYFDLINHVDDFIIYDTVQYTKNDWRNRNRIKTPGGLQWLTIPVEHRFLGQTIADTKIATVNWNKKHWNAITTNYAKSKFFKEYRDYFEKLYRGFGGLSLSQVNLAFIRAICEILEIETRIRQSSEFDLSKDRNLRLLEICEYVGASIYVSGPAAKVYLDEKLFVESGVEVEWMDYNGYPVYDQKFPPFDHAVTVLDLIFNEGPEAKKYMKSFKL